jgi:hypothetical protein
MSVHVDTHGLPDRLERFCSTEGEAKRALRSAMVKIGGKGRTLVRQKTPSKTGASRRGIKSTTKVLGVEFTTTIFPSGPHAHVTRWQDQGTGPRHKKKNGQYTGIVEPQYMFERSATELDVVAAMLVEDSIGSAIVKAGLR